jgi:LPXTG-motif cell wall-anchored protein
LLALLLLVVILRTVQTDGDQTFIAVLSLIGVATLAGALLLRRRRNRKTHPASPAPIVEPLQTRRTLDSGAGTTVRNREAVSPASARTSLSLRTASKCMSQHV